MPQSANDSGVATDRANRRLTHAENACVQITQKRVICAGNKLNCSRIEFSSAVALRYPARNEGAYWLRMGSAGWSLSAVAK